MYKSAFVVLSALALTGCPVLNLDSQPEANFTGSPRSGNTGLVVSFTNLSATVADGSIVSWQWEFGDGSRSAEPNPVHTYLTPGDFSVSLTVTSSGGTHTRVRNGYIVIDAPSGSDQVDETGGTVSSNGVSITIPEGALASRVNVGITRVTTQIPLGTYETTNRVGNTFRITHDSTTRLSGTSSAAPIAPVVLKIPYAEDVVDTGNRTTAKVHIVAQLETGELIPILGTIVTGAVSAEVTDLPQRALYTVVYRPDAYLATTSVSAKAPTSTAWNDTWRVSLSPTLLTQLTALRLGDIQNSSSFYEDDFTEAQLGATETALLRGLVAAQQLFDSVGSRSPRLTTLRSAHMALCFNTLQLYPTDLSSLSDVFYAGSPFGSIVLDPRQLLAVSAWNADRLQSNPNDPGTLNIAQILSADQAIGEALTRAVVAGYDIPERAVGSEGVGWLDGVREGLALYVGQLNGGLDINRSQNDGDVALLSTPVFAPIDVSIPGYGAASQDFYRYIAKTYEPAIPLAYVASGTGVVNGLLEEIRQSLTSVVSPTLQDASLLTSAAIDRAFLAYLEVGLGEAYFNYALALGFERGPENALRPSDVDQPRRVLDTSRFAEFAQMSGNLTGPNAGLDFPRAGDVGLTAIPPLSSRVITVGASPAAATLTLTFNREDWVEDVRNQSVRIVVYREGLAGRELPADEDSLVFTDFEADSGNTLALFHVVIVNTSISTSNSVAMTVESSTLPNS